MKLPKRFINTLKIIRAFNKNCAPLSDPQPEQLQEQFYCVYSPKEPVFLLVVRTAVGDLN